MTKRQKPPQSVTERQAQAYRGEREPGGDASVQSGTLVLGNGRSGVSQEVLACAGQAIAISMLGMANSLNVATAGAIVLHMLAHWQSS